MKKFSNQVTALFLAGGQVVATYYGTLSTLIVRMPKQSFVSEFDEEWEYVIIQNYHNESEYHIAQYRNGGLAQVKREVKKEHEVDSAQAYRAKKNQEKYGLK